MKLTITIPLDNPRFLTWDEYDQKFYGDGSVLGKILRNLADSWEDQMVIMDQPGSPLTEPDGSVVGTITVGGQ